MRSFVPATLVASAALFSAAQGITIIKPAAGDTVDASKGFDIVWEYGSSDPTDWEIELGNPTPGKLLATDVKPASASAGQTATYTYTVKPTNIADGSYKVILDPRNVGTPGTSLPESGEFTVGSGGSGTTTTSTLPGATTSTSTGTGTVPSTISPSTPSAQPTSYTSNPSAEPASTGTNAATTTSTITPTPTNTNLSGNSGSGESSSSSGGLSTGAKAGIGIAVLVAVIILALGIFLFCRRRKAAKNNNQLDSNGGDNLHEVGGDPEKFIPFGGVEGRSEADARPALAEADGNPLNESDSRSILTSPGSQNQPRTTAPIYELSGNSTAIRPPPAALAPHRQNESLNRQCSVTSSTNISRKAVGSPPTQTESEIEGGRASSSKDLASAVNDALVSLQLSEKTNNSEQQSSEQKEPETESNARTSASVEQNDLQQLEEEMAQVRAQRERLQHLQMLEEREEQLKKQIAARKAAKSTE